MGTSMTNMTCLPSFYRYCHNMRAGTVLRSCAPAMLLDTERMELFICASRSTTALTSMAAAVLLHRSGKTTSAAARYRI